MVVIARRCEPIENDLRGSIRFVVTVSIRNEDQLGRSHQPDAAAADLDAGQHLQVVGEDFSFVVLPVPILVFKDHDPVAQAQVKDGAAIGIGIVLCHPQPPPSIPGHRDRVTDIRLRGEDRDLEPLRQLKPFRSFLGRKRQPGSGGLGIVRLGKGRGGVGDWARAI